MRSWRHDSDDSSEAMVLNRRTAGLQHTDLIKGALGSWGLLKGIEIQWIGLIGLSKDCLNEVFESLSLKQDDLVFFGAGKTKIVNEYMSRLINKIGIDLNLISEGFEACWITDFPMFELNSDRKVTSLHHPFTAPRWIMQNNSMT